MKKIVLIALFTLSIPSFADSVGDLLKVKGCTLTVKEDILFSRGQSAATVREEPSGFSMYIEVTEQDVNSSRRLAKDRQISIVSPGPDNCLKAQDQRVLRVCVTNLVGPLSSVSLRQFNNLSNNKLEITCEDEGHTVDL